MLITIIAALVVGLAIIMAGIIVSATIISRTPEPNHIQYVIRKDPDMASAFEQIGDLRTQLETLKAQVAAHQDPSTGFASAESVSDLSARLQTVSDNLGTPDQADPTPAPAPTPVDTTTTDQPVAGV